MINWPFTGRREYCQFFLHRKRKFIGDRVEPNNFEAHRKFSSSDWMMSLVSSLIEAVV